MNVVESEIFAETVATIKTFRKLWKEKFSGQNAYVRFCRAGNVLSVTHFGVLESNVVVQKHLLSDRSGEDFVFTLPRADVLNVVKGVSVGQQKVRSFQYADGVYAYGVAQSGKILDVDGLPDVLPVDGDVFYPDWGRMVTCAKFASTDVARPILNGVLVAKTGAVAATDSYRLACTKHAVPDDYVLIPAKIVSGLGKLAASDTMCCVSYDEGGASVEVSNRVGGTMRWIGSSIEGGYPDYSRIVSSVDKIERLTGESAALAEVLNQASRCADPVVFDKNDSVLHVSCGDKTWSLNGSCSVRTSFNPMFLESLVRETGLTVFSIRGADSWGTPWVVETVNGLTLSIMPVKI